MSVHAQLWRRLSVLFLAAGIGALIVSGTGYLRAPRSRPPGPACAAALHADGWTLPRDAGRRSVQGGVLTAHRRLDFSDWRGVIYTTDAALGACRGLVLRSACIGPACGARSSLTFTLGPK